MIPLLFSVMLLASDTSAAATTAATDPTEQAVPAKKVKEKKICKEDPAYTGSRMKKQICLTEVDWEKRRLTGVNSDRAGSSDSAEH
jgi:hypothetical protein